jgi:membrane dipeptidase
MNRRDFLVAAGAAAVAPRFAGLEAQPARPRVIDGLGEIHLDYSTALLDEMRASGMRACVVTVGNPALQGATAFDDMRTEALAYDAHIPQTGGRLSKAVNAADIDRAALEETIALVYYTQNATPIGDDVAKLDELHKLGVRIVQLTYNTRNLLGDGCLERTNAGLSTFGLAVIEGMKSRKMLIDVSHTGEASSLDAIKLAQVPVAITHAGCKGVYDHPRNKSDSLLRAMAEGGGVIGIYQINPYLGPNERNTLDTYIAHIEHAINVAGIEHVGIGSDREHRTIPDTPEEKQKLIDELSRLRPVNAANFRWPFFISELNHPRRMETIRRALEVRRRPAADIDRIMGGNFYRLFRDTIG